VTAVELVPITLRQARAFNYEHHRRQKELGAGALFAVALVRGPDLVGVAIAGRPSAGGLDDGRSLEVLRCCVLEGVPNGCSMLYRALVRAGEALGYLRFFTYTAEAEHGRSLRAAGFVPDAMTRGGPWSRRARRRRPGSDQGRKVRWHVERETDSTPPPSPE
jgi:hypothetical protein